MNSTELSKVCLAMRRDIINMTTNAGSGHPGGSLSSVELLASIFFNHMRVDPKDPKNPDRDRFVLSKGHAAPTPVFPWVRTAAATSPLRISA